MPDFALVPIPPSRNDLIRFFRTRRPFAVGEAARLLGWMEPQLFFELRDEGALLPDGAVAWADVASRLLLAWPRPWLLESLGTNASLVPEGLHPVPVRWTLPRYVILAMEMQARLHYSANPGIHTTDVAHYVGDLLHLAIEPDTVDALRAHHAFTESFHFPNDEEGNGE